MKLKKFKERDNKRTGIIVFTIACILLVSGVILYRTFAIFEVKTSQNVIKGTVQDPENIYFAFYVDDEIQKDMPQKNGEYIFDEENSYCGVTGEKEHDDSIQLEFDKDRWSITVVGLKTSRTKCNLKFVSGAYILDKPIKAVTSGDGLYKVTHGDEVTGTLNDEGFKETEWRYAGSSPNNYVNFNGEKWRIIGLVNVMTGENKLEQRVKIIKNESIGDYSWDKETFTTTDWNGSELNNMLNKGYYYSQEQVVCYKGENNQISQKSECDFLSKGLSGLSRNMIDGNIIWNIGDGKGQNADETASQFYNDERTKKSNVQSVGLLNPSDYGYAVGGSNRETCLSKYLHSYNGDCSNNDWLWLGITISDKVEWTLTLDVSSKAIYYITNLGYVHIRNQNIAAIVRPTLYLNPNVKIVNDTNDGSESKPYQLQQV